MISLKNLAFVAVAIVTTACSRDGLGSDSSRAIVIDPTVSRATELSFESGDRIGVTIIRNGETFLSNREFTSNGSVFSSSGTVWYTGTQSSTIRAYYPYSSAGEPVTFTVQTDQRSSGYTASDFMTALKSNVVPGSGSVQMLFRHRMVKINIIVDNRSTGVVTGAGILSCGLTATVDVAGESASPYASTAKGDIAAYETAAGSLYNAIIAPQSASLTFYVTLDDGSERRTATMSAAEFGSGLQFTARLTVTDNVVDVTMSGEIEAWGSNTDLTPEGNSGGNGQNSGNGGGSDDPQSPGEKEDGPSTGGSVMLGGVSYPTVTLADGRTWTAVNLRYVPADKSVSDDPTDGSGVWYPCDNTKEANTGSDFIEQHGYLYSANVAHGGKAVTGEEAVQGICPDGWHLPTAAEFEALKAAYATATALQASEFGLVTGGIINATQKYAYSGNGEFDIWGSSVNGSGEVNYFRISSALTYVTDLYTGTMALSVRCIQNK